MNAEENTEILDTCIFRNGIVCTNRTLCSSCGFNPTIEKEQKERVRAERKENGFAVPYKFIIRKENIYENY